MAKAKAKKITKKSAKAQAKKAISKAKKTVAKARKVAKKTAKKTAASVTKAVKKAAPKLQKAAQRAVKKVAAAAPKTSVLHVVSPGAPKTPQVGDWAPQFSAQADDGRTIHLKDYAGQKIVLYFYPKDDTPGCTQEACDFRDSMGRLNTAQAVVLGVSRDDVKSHQKFKAKFGLTFPLLADTNGDICEAYGVWKEKSMYGRKYMGIERSTFLIGQDGKIAKVYSPVKVQGHVDAILEDLKSI